MKIGIWSSHDAATPEVGPYRLLDTVENPDPYRIGDATDYGPVLSFIPLVAESFGNAEQSVVVRLDRSIDLAVATKNMNGQSPDSYSKIQFLPVTTDLHAYLSSSVPLAGSYAILPDEKLSIEDVSPLITAETFAVWKQDCFLSKSIVTSLESVSYAIVHRYSSESARDGTADARSLELVNVTAACLSLIRPTRRGQAGIVIGIMVEGGGFRAEKFGTSFVQDVPPVQRVFAVRPKDVETLHEVLPEFLQIYLKDESGSLNVEYEPLRMAVQLYEQGYAVHYWKVKHILWWAAVEAVFGNAEDAAMARIYAIFGDGDLSKGYEYSIYEPSDVPSSTSRASASHHRLGELLSLIYEVRNYSAHGDRVPERFFKQVSHPIIGQASLLDVLAEAMTFIIRKTIVGILYKKLTGEFKDRKTRDIFWLQRFGLDNRQSKKRLAELIALKTGQGRPAARGRTRK